MTRNPLSTFNFKAYKARKDLDLLEGNDLDFLLNRIRILRGDAAQKTITEDAITLTVTDMSHPEDDMKIPGHDECSISLKADTGYYTVEQSYTDVHFNSTKVENMLFNDAAQLFTIKIVDEYIGTKRLEVLDFLTGASDAIYICDQKISCKPRYT